MCVRVNIVHCALKKENTIFSPTSGLSEEFKMMRVPQNHALHCEKKNTVTVTGYSQLNVK